MIINDSEVVRQLMQYYITGVRPEIPVIDNAVAGQGLVVDADTTPKSLTYGEGSGGGGAMYLDLTIIGEAPEEFTCDKSYNEILDALNDVPVYFRIKMKAAESSDSFRIVEYQPVYLSFDELGVSFMDYNYTCSKDYTWSGHSPK